MIKVSDDLRLLLESLSTKELGKVIKSAAQESKDAAIFICNSIADRAELSTVSQKSEDESMLVSLLKDADTLRQIAKELSKADEDLREGLVNESGEIFKFSDEIIEGFAEAGLTRSSINILYGCSDKQHLIDTLLEGIRGVQDGFHSSLPLEARKSALHLISVNFKAINEVRKSMEL